MINKQRSKEVAHWQKVINKYNRISDRRPLTSDERQQRNLAEHNIEKLYETQRF